MKPNELIRKSALNTGYGQRVRVLFRELDTDNWYGFEMDIATYTFFPYGVNATLKMFFDAAESLGHRSITEAPESFDDIYLRSN